ncbi:MAG: PIN domain-containing protein [Bacteroidota bacterium]
MGEVLLDTSHVVALASAGDQHHEVARRWQRHLESDANRIVTTQAVLLEVGNSLAGGRLRRSAVAVIEGILLDPSIEVIPLAPDLFNQSFDLFRERLDKEWGLVDCISFVVMRERGIQAALTADIHFRQAGFRALLLEDAP